MDVLSSPGLNLIFTSKKKMLTNMQELEVVYLDLLFTKMK
jgi:hypothetical protein